MDPKLIFLPVLAHMILLFFLFITLGRVKTKAIKDGRVDRQKTALDIKAWPDNVVKISNNIANQFETPMMFYALTFMVFLTNSVNGIVLALMSLYVASRYLHTYFHITRNYVPHRFKAFVFGFLILLGVAVWQIILIISF